MERSRGAQGAHALTAPPITSSPTRSPAVEMRIGIRRAPSAMAPIKELSSAPNTRPMTSSGTTRWRIVYTLMSTSEFAIPMRRSAMTALGSVGDAAISSSGPPRGRHRVRSRTRAGPAVRERAPRTPPASPPTPSCLEIADACLPEFEHVERDGDDEHGRCARNDALCGVEPDERTQIGRTQDRREPGRGLTHEPHRRLSSAGSAGR